MRIRQVVFAAHDLRSNEAVLAKVFDLAPPFADPGVGEFGIHNGVFVLGDQFVEIITPTRPDTACGRHLQRHGDSGYMLILQTDDLARDRERFERLGVRSIWSSVHDDISAMHLHPKDVGGAIVSVDEPRPAPSWRWGGPQWRVQEGRFGQQRVRGITMHARDPVAMAARWSEVFDRPPPRRVGDRVSIDLTDGVVDFLQAPMQAVGDGIAGFTLAMAEPQAVLRRAREEGLAVDGNRVSLLGTQLTITAS